MVETEQAVRFGWVDQLPPAVRFALAQYNDMDQLATVPESVAKQIIPGLAHLEADDSEESILSSGWEDPALRDSKSLQLLAGIILLSVSPNQQEPKKWLQSAVARKLDGMRQHRIWRIHVKDSLAYEMSAKTLTETIRRTYNYHLPFSRGGSGDFYESVHALQITAALLLVEDPKAIVYPDAVDDFMAAHADAEELYAFVMEELKSA